MRKRTYARLVGLSALLFAIASARRGRRRKPNRARRRLVAASKV